MIVLTFVRRTREDQNADSSLTDSHGAICMSTKVRPPDTYGGHMWSGPDVPYLMGPYPRCTK